MRIEISLVALLCGLGAASTAAEERFVDTERSSITVRVPSEGLLRALARPITIQGQLSEGTVEESVPHMQVVLDARRLRVIGTGDAGLSEKDRREVQARMLGSEVLDANRFPRISYHSITIEPLPSGTPSWLIKGELELRGLILPVNATARRVGGRYVGAATVRQSAFGIAPVSRWGGLVRLKDAVDIAFEVSLVP